MIVVDTNIIASLYLPTDGTETAERLKVAQPDWMAPYLWRSEFRNVLSNHMRHAGLLLEDAVNLQNHAEAMMRGWEYDPISVDVLTLAQESGCTAYDCEFVALAMATKTELATLDKKILRVFPAIAFQPG